MKKWLPFVIIAALIALGALGYSAENCASKCSSTCTSKCGFQLSQSGDHCSGKCSGKCAGKAGCKSQCSAKCDNPDWGYAYQSADFYPDKAPDELKEFHEVLLPVREARKSYEVAYIREAANSLYCASKQVRKSYPSCADRMLKKHYKRAAKELIRDSKRLKEMVHGGSDDAVLTQVKRIEEDFIRLANLSD